MSSVVVGHTKKDDISERISIYYTIYIIIISMCYNIL